MVMALFYGGPADHQALHVTDPPPDEWRIAVPPRPYDITSPNPEDWFTEGWVAEYARTPPDRVSGPGEPPRYVWRRRAP